MAIKIIEEPDVHVTADDLARYRDSYRKFCSYYCGTPPTFESYVRAKVAEKTTQGFSP